MNTHPYLRAYMAGIVLPSLGLLVALTAFILTRLVFHVPMPRLSASSFSQWHSYPMHSAPGTFSIFGLGRTAIGPSVSTARCCRW